MQSRLLYMNMGLLTVLDCFVRKIVVLQITCIAHSSFPIVFLCDFALAVLDQRKQNPKSYPPDSSRHAAGAAGIRPRQNEHLLP